MESSRSGLLSTLIMTIPLIVVPAIALLRPPMQNGGLLNDGVHAASDTETELDGFPEIFDDLSGDNPDNSERPERKEKSSGEESEFAELFPEEDMPAAPAARTQRKSTETSHSVPDFGESGDMPDLTKKQDAAPIQPVKPDELDANSIEILLLRELNDSGVTRTLWFLPGDEAQTGFIAFVPGADPEIQYRFEAIGPTRVAAIRDVVQQITNWQMSRRQSPR